MYDNIKDLLNEIKRLQSPEYDHNSMAWQEMAVRAWNDFCEDFDRWGDEVIDPCLEKFEGLVRRELKDGGYPRVKCFLAGLDYDANWATIDSAGNAQTVGRDFLINCLKEAEFEIEDYLKDVK